MQPPLYEVMGSNIRRFHRNGTVTCKSWGSSLALGKTIWGCHSQVDVEHSSGDRKEVLHHYGLEKSLVNCRSRHKCRHLPELDHVRGPSSFSALSKAFVADMIRSRIVRAGGLMEGSLMCKSDAVFFLSGST